MEAAGVAVRRGDPPEAARRAYRQYGRARCRRGRPPDGNPRGRGLLRRGFVEGLVRISRYDLRPSPAHVAKSLRRRRFHL